MTMTDPDAARTALTLMELIGKQAPDSTFDLLLYDVDDRKVMLAAASIGASLFARMRPEHRTMLIDGIRRNLLDLESRGIVEWGDLDLG